MMKRQLPLKWSLTLSILGVLVFITVVFILVFQSLIARIDERLRHTMTLHHQANAVDVASNIGYEVAIKDEKALKEKIEPYLRQDNNIHSISVISPDRSILYTTDKKANIKNLLKKITKVDVKFSMVLDSQTVATAPILLEKNQISGAVMLVISLESYLRDKRYLWWGMFITSVLGLIVILGSAYLIGQRASAPVHRLVEAAQRFADGDLRQIDVAIRGSNETVHLSKSIERMAEAMQTQVLAIKKLTTGISEISRETEGTMTNLASSATQQAAAVNETAATVEEMEKAGQSAAGNAKQIVAAAEKTAEASTRGRQTVEKTYDIIMQIKDESQDISDKSRNLLNSVEEVGNIIQSVNSIAEQSKILAVNASIEAAKAGEFGSGFAVVAQEVKDLAQQSKDATVQITGTLTAIRAAIETMVATAQSGKEKTEEGVNTIANAGAVMNDLSEAIRENSDFANVIATNIKQQTVGLTQIAAAIEEINTTALENQSISRNIVDGTRQMNNSLSLLSDMVGRWRTPNNIEPEITTQTKKGATE